jgi:hypothetical protein
MYPLSEVPTSTGTFTSESDRSAFISFIGGEDADEVIANLVFRPSCPPTTSYTYALMMTHGRGQKEVVRGGTVTEAIRIVKCTHL